MTHNTDCTLKDSARADINAIARCFYYGVKDRLKNNSPRRDIDHWDDVDRLERKCVDMATDLDMEFAGAGLARSVFTAVPDPETAQPDDSEVTEFSKCVVKFARYSNDDKQDGKVQNGDEIDNYQKLPPRAVEERGGEPPVFNPLKEWDQTEQKWITQPYCPPPGSVMVVQRRLDQIGYEAPDLHSDNVGEYPDHVQPAVIDYGFPVSRKGNRMQQQFDNIRDALNSMSALGIEETRFNNGGGAVRFYPPEDLPGEDRPPEKSRIAFGGSNGVTEIEVYFPAFDTGMFTDTEIQNNLNAMGYSPTVAGAGVKYTAAISMGSVSPRVLVQIPRRDPISPKMAIEEYEEMEKRYNDHFSRFITGYGKGGSAPTQQPGVTGIQQKQDFTDVEAQWRGALLGAGMRNVTFPSAGPGGRGPDVKFHPPLDVNPRPSVVESNIFWFTPATVEKVSYRAADVRAGVVTQSELNTKAGDVVDEVRGRFSGLGISKGLRLPRFDPAASGEVRAVQYDVVPDGGHIPPETVIEVLEVLTDTHNQNFQPTA